MLKQILSIALLGFYLSAALELMQWLKLPDFVRHYIEHHKNSDEGNLEDFFSQHYFSDDEAANSSEEHSKLPFKEDHIACTVLIAFHQELGKTTCAPLCSIANSTFTSQTSDFTPFGLCFDIWQPPKITA